MSAAEINAAKRRDAPNTITKGYTATGACNDKAGARADMRATLRTALRFCGDVIPMRWRSRGRRAPPGRAMRYFRIDGTLRQDAATFLHVQSLMIAIACIRSCSERGLRMSRDT